MGKIAIFLGVVWTIVGIGNILLMPWGSSSTGLLTFGMIFNMILFILPGLVVYGIGKHVDLH